MYSCVHHDRTDDRMVLVAGLKSRVALIKVKMDSRAVVLGGAAARASFLQQVRDTRTYRD